MLSKELGTKLTGRQITKELFPFSYHEFNQFKKLKPSADSLKQYLHTGGFPEFVKQGVNEILNHVFEDILIRDIAVRYDIRYREIYYFSEKQECDFVVFSNRKAVAAIQVCLDLNPDNIDREMDGLIAALEELKLKEGSIITLDQKDRFEKDGRMIHVIPCHEFLRSPPSPAKPGPPASAGRP